MRKLLAIGAALGVALFALPSLGEEASAPPAKMRQKATPPPAKARVKAQPTPVKARQTAEPTKAAATEASEGGETGDTAEATEGGGAAANLPQNVAEFVTAMREQISKAGGRARCDAPTGRCSYRHRNGEGPNHDIQLWYNEQSRSIYIFVNQFASAPRTESSTPAVIRHLAAVNRILGIARFEWNPEDGEVRLSAILNADTNFDRRALRNLLRFVQDAADRYHPAIAAVAAGGDDVPDLPSPSSNSPGQVSDRHGYMDAIEDELNNLDLQPTCDDDNGRCTFEFQSEEAGNFFLMVVQYNSQANTVTVSTDRYIPAIQANPRTNRLLQRLLELNWGLLVPMFQWNAANGHVTVSGALNTDSNFDRRAFRGVVQSVNQVVVRHFRELRGIMNPAGSPR